MFRYTCINHCVLSLSVDNKIKIILQLTIKSVFLMTARFRSHQPHGLRGREQPNSYAWHQPTAQDTVYRSSTRFAWLLVPQFLWLAARALSSKWPPLNHRYPHMVFAIDSAGTVEDNSTAFIRLAVVAARKVIKEAPMLLMPSITLTHCTRDIMHPHGVCYRQRGYICARTALCVCGCVCRQVM